ncbi:hypothetical protein SERLA73DRAFT_191406 [Serpula lacrymans var. lacrymans S7.3]|uniref:Uncharacterized protein n=2 Tax=Serpula lacrymans var. lacrymans TaxID=341189 RepID=F8QHH0_SERL3|nr:uncharacterized protein SERLADRAFT_472767 [Serpula lacrymans var. lacrymans S7.9]EGN92280.1 hypothetical protein SERLA73DRAFT_191406 [Serpula lacrymans var. lacrymans S7.3]EGO22233.1 hypothetical protein SERLADRAFT_472767 [Serpula lacrymans var. lacrymans S7.9]
MSNSLDASGKVVKAGLGGKDDLLGPVQAFVDKLKFTGSFEVEIFLVNKRDTKLEHMVSACVLPQREENIEKINKLQDDFNQLSGCIACIMNALDDESIPRYYGMRVHTELAPKLLSICEDALNELTFGLPPIPAALPPPIVSSSSLPPAQAKNGCCNDWTYAWESLLSHVASGIAETGFVRYSSWLTDNDPKPRVNT